MAAKQIRCRECGAWFHARADARYCSGTCRQKAYRARARRRAVLEAAPAADLENLVVEARRNQQLARATRKHAQDARLAAKALRRPDGITTA